MPEDIERTAGKTGVKTQPGRACQVPVQHKHAWNVGTMPPQDATAQTTNLKFLQF